MGNQLQIRLIVHNVINTTKDFCKSPWMKKFLYSWQRIEAWWSQLRLHHMEWWINFFKVRMIIAFCHTIHSCDSAQELTVNGFLQLHLPHHMWVHYTFGWKFQCYFRRLLTHNILYTILFAVVFKITSLCGVCSDAVRFCFGGIIQQQLQELVTEWNSHNIRHSNMAEVPAGKPDVLYYFPELQGRYLVCICN